MRKILAGLFSLCATLTFAQPVQQTGNVTPGHVAMWTTTGIVQDAGSAANGFISSLGIQNNGGPGLCLNSAPITGPYNQLCLAVSTAANAQISLQNFGGAAAENLNIVINGTSYPFPGALSGITINTTAVTGGSNGQCLFISSGTVGSQSCATNVVVGTTTIGSGTANGLLYDAAGVLGNLATGNNGVLVTSAGGVPSISTTLPSGLTIPAPTVTGALTYGGVTLASSVTGTGSMVLGTSPSLTTPMLGVASATTVNKVTLTAPATGSTLTIADGKTLTANNSLTFAGTDSTTMTFPGSSDTVVGLAATQTLTNKTLTTPVINNASTLSTGTNGVTGGQLVLNGSTSGAVTVSVNAGAGTTNFRLPNTNGTNGQLLSTDGSGNTSWSTASGTGTVTSLSAGVGLATGTGAAITTAGTLSAIRSPQGRLTLVTGVPVMVANETAKSTLYYDCYLGGNSVPYYDGTDDHSEAVAACEVSDAMVSAASAGQVVSGQVYDVWWVHSGTNRICLAMSASGGGGGGWASDTGGSNTARGTGYSQLDYSTRPYITNKNSIANCFNGATNYGSVSANQATYLGTIYATANGQTGVAFTGSGSGGGGNVIGVFNGYNRVPISATSQDTATSWSCNACAWRKADNNANNSIQWVDGLQVLSAECVYGALSAPQSSAQDAAVGCAFDWTSGAPPVFASMIGNGIFVYLSSASISLPLFGLHTANAVESTVGNAPVFYGSGGAGFSGQTQQLTLRLML